MMYSSDSEGEICIFPITDLGDTESDKESDNEDQNKNKTEERPKALMSLRQRRLSKANAALDSLKSTNLNLLKLSTNRLNDNDINSAQRHWLDAIRKAKMLKDPWAKFHLDELQIETAIRYRYNTFKKEWSKDEVKVKVESSSFNRGAMRQCYRLKKLSTFTHSDDWKHAQNYVAKRYIEDVDREVYFEDVKLQMNAKLWGEEYNRHNPPKKVDIFQMYCLEFINRAGSPLYHLEHFIEGEYIKYNSNSGFVEETLRLTPQTFSHFTFERSGHQLIVVDIQGVGDLYTDPQIHTADGKDFGDGNLGPKGMALFFHSHICNNICHSLGLSEFDLASNEIKMHETFLSRQKASAAFTMIRGKEEQCLSPSPREKMDLTQLLRRHSSKSSADSSAGSLSCEEEPMMLDSPVGRVRMRYTSESEASMTEDEEREHFQRMSSLKSRPSCVLHEINLRNVQNLKIGDSLLGKVHHELAKYHEICRFQEPGSEPDWDSALFHEEHAAQLGELEAIVTMAKLYLNLSRDVLVNCTIESNEEMINKGVDYMMQAAEAGDRNAMLYMANAFKNGNGLGTIRSCSWEDAVYWYEQAIKTFDSDEGGEFDCTMDNPVYQLLETQADMYLAGGHGLDRDPQRAGELYNEAAEAAMAMMKGRLANKFFALAEEAWSQCEEEE